MISSAGKNYRNRYRLSLIVITVLISLSLINSNESFKTKAAVQTSNANVNVTALVLPPVPTTPAVISSPQNNSKFNTRPLVVRGTCGAGLIVRIFNNNELAGSATCSGNGKFIINITLSEGKNIIKALNYDSYDQAGPASASITVYVIENVVQNSPIPIQMINTPSSPLPSPDTIKIFSYSPLEPLAIIWGIDLYVSRLTNIIIAVVIYVILLLLLLILLANRRSSDDDSDE